ncbi:MAG: hypothetical protein AABY22_18160 [Nanoarchaeota archaeon]
MERLQGKKSYIISGATAVYAVLGLVLGYLDMNQTIQLLLAAGALVGVKSALTKLE